MQEHYTAIAKIIGGVLNGSRRLDAIINTLIHYFESEDENFNSQEFRAKCFNGDNEAVKSEEVVTPSINEITSSIPQNQANNWNPQPTSSGRVNDYGFKKAMSEMTDTIVKTLGNENKIKR